VLKRVFGSKREEVAGGWRGLHNEEFHNLYASPNVNRMIKQRRMGRACTIHERDEKCIQNFGQKI
jgi:hypothetical protein